MEVAPASGFSGGPERLSMPTLSAALMHEVLRLAGRFACHPMASIIGIDGQSAPVGTRDLSPFILRIGVTPSEVVS